MKALIPRPVELHPGDGVLPLVADTAIGAPTPQTPAAALLGDMLRRATGLAVPVHAGEAGQAAALRLRLQDDAATRRQLGEEGYRLDVRPAGATLTAATDTGLLWAVQTVRQLLPPQIESQRPVAGVEWCLPVLRLEDRPRFAWRGGHLDVCRHFFDLDFVLRYIDLLALHKQNVFHWHLTEDQGWRLQIDRHPELTAVGAWRTPGPEEADLGHRDGQGRYGGCYTQAEARQVVAYAAARGITVVPEIELPGHALGALAAYPQLGCTGGPYEVTGQWGVFDDVFCAGNDAVFGLLQDVFAEVLEVFPGQFVHVGGDECPKTRWQACPKCQARIRDEGLADAHELQSWVIRQFDGWLSERGRRLIGWDEILEGGLAAGAAVMSWRGTEGGLTAARAGHDVVMCPNQYVYLDYRHYEGDDEPGRLGVCSTEKAYSFDPTIPELSAAEARHVLGVQANVWSEGFGTPPRAEQQVWPRMSAVAEIGWTAQADREFGDFAARVRGLAAHYEAAGLHYYRDRAIWS